MWQSDSPTLDRNANAWREAFRTAVRAAKAAIMELCSSGEWVRRGVIVVRVRRACSPEILVRVCQRESCRPSRMRPNNITVERQAWSGAKRAVTMAVSSMKVSGGSPIVESRGIGDWAEVRLLRMPRRNSANRHAEAVCP